MELFFRRFISSNNPQRKWINPGFLAGPYLPLYGFKKPLPLRPRAKPPRPRRQLRRLPSRPHPPRRRRPPRALPPPPDVPDVRHPLLSRRARSAPSPHGGPMSRIVARKAKRRPRRGVSPAASARSMRTCPCCPRSPVVPSPPLRLR
ncbi:MAG: hypothetical protein ACI364_05820 [Coriobacteriales bacterium]